MIALTPFNRRNSSVDNAGFDDYYNFFGDRWFQDRSGTGRDIFKIDVKEIGDRYTVEADLPGIKRDEIDLNVDDKMLLISINHEERADEGNEKYIHKERRKSSMSRSIRLTNANLNDINAKLDNGVLTIDVPKHSGTNETRRIEIQ